MAVAVATTSSSAVNGCPVAVARSQPCTVSSMMVIIPAKGAGKVFGPKEVSPSQAPGSAQAAVSWSRSGGYTTQGASVSVVGASAGSACFLAAYPLMVSTPSRCSLSPWTSNAAHGVGSSRFPVRSDCRVCSRRLRAARASWSASSTGLTLMRVAPIQDGVEVMEEGAISRRTERACPSPRTS
ncbi:hypothetical protein O1M63_07785 [Streptomyces mirabilis]|nr:hypothetical protein [Streptomyces mirabilis]